MGQEVIIEKAKAEWAHEFEAEKQQLADVLGKKVLAKSAVPLFPALQQNRYSI
jgi:GrpB-like predicted nucleotidyltransferase (UPF0157 family)